MEGVTRARDRSGPNQTEGFLEGVHSQALNTGVCEREKWLNKSQRQGQAGHIWELGKLAQLGRKVLICCDNGNQGTELELGRKVGSLASFVGDS